MSSRDPAPAGLDRRRVREAFARAARDYDHHARVQREIGERLLEHLGPVRLEPARVLDAGAGTGLLTGPLCARYRRALVIGLDIAEPMLAVARAKGPRLFSRQRFVCGDGERLPLASASVDLVVSNLLLQWFDHPESMFRECARVLARGRLLMFSTFGPDTLRELRESWAVVDGHVHVHRFLDMHDVGDALVRSGFVDVVMETERLVVQYPDVTTLMSDLKGLGAHNASAGRVGGLTGKGRLARMREAYERWRGEGGLPATFEVIYGHAWTPARSPLEVPLASLRR